MAKHPDGGRILAFLRVDAPRNHRIPGTHRGALSPAVAILAVMIFTLAGLVIDGGRQLGAKSRAVGYAQEAARVGAATIDLNSDQAKIDTEKAATAVAAFCAQVTSNDPAVRECGTTKVTAEDLAVQVTISNKTTFLGMVGIGSLESHGTGEAHAEQGIKKADETPQIPPIFVVPTTDGPGDIVTSDVPPPVIDAPCPTWTVGETPPPWTLPVPSPTTCTPVTPPTGPPSSSPPPSGSPPPPSSAPPGGGGPGNTAAPRNSVPPGVGG
jgi:hypothetical protein